jgi:hypothetical protein
MIFLCIITKAIKAIDLAGSKLIEPIRGLGSYDAFEAWESETQEACRRRPAARSGMPRALECKHHAG